MKIQDMPSSRVTHWKNALLIEALQGLIRRYGTGIIEANELELQRLILVYTAEKSAAEISLYWCKEILREFHYRLSTGRITWPPEDNRE
jgi:hypothetical protein